MREKLIRLSIECFGNAHTMYQRLRHDKELKKDRNECSSGLPLDVGFKVLTILDDEYPASLFEMSLPPFVLYYRGDIGLLSRGKVSIVGGKKPSDYTKMICRDVMGNMSPSVVIVRGSTFGVERLIGTKGVKVLAAGIDTLCDGELVISEYPPGVRFDWKKYYRSYRLVSALSDVLCTFELSESDGRLEYLRYLVGQGHPVLALPDRIDVASASGCIELIASGAMCLRRARDVLEAIERI